MPADGRVHFWSLARGVLPLLTRLPQVLHGYRLSRTGQVERRLSIGRILERNARRWPEHPALRFEGRDLSHRQLNAQANRMARLLAHHGIGHGDRVGILMENRPELIFCVAAVVKLGAVAVVHNCRLPAPSLAHCMRLAPSRAFLVGQELRPVFEQVKRTFEPSSESTSARRDGAPVETFWVADGPDATLRPDDPDLLEQARDFADDNLSQTAEVKLGDPCFYVFTSGTTGLPKAAVIKHIRWIKAMGAFGHMALRLKPGQVLYNVLPFYHGTALAVGWSACAATGACLGIGRRFSASHFWAEMRAMKAVGFVYIGELCRFLINQPASDDDRNHDAIVMVGNGLRPDIWNAFKQRFGIRRVHELYGASEANIAFFNIFNQDRTIGFCPADYALVACDRHSGEAVRNARGRLDRVGPGRIGLLLGKVTGSYPFDGYTDRQASEARLIRDAFEPGDCWFNTGDLLRDIGYRHARFVDRLGDTYRWRGENVATTEVEAVAMALPAIAEAVAYGVQIPGCEGRAGMLAFRLTGVVDGRRDERPDEPGAVEQLEAQFKECLPEYAIPVFLRRVEQVDATQTFKFIRRDLVDEGFDIVRIDSPVWIRLAERPGYQRLTEERLQQLRQGELGF